MARRGESVRWRYDSHEYGGIVSDDSVAISVVINGENVIVYRDPSLNSVDIETCDGEDCSARPKTIILPSAVLEARH